MILVVMRNYKTQKNNNQNSTVLY